MYDINPFVQYRNFNSKYYIGKDYKYFELDEISNDIWNFIVAGHDLDSIVSNITQEYNVDEDVCRKDIKEFLEELKKNEFIYD